jgi:chromate transport protein ChrA
MSVITPTQLFVAFFKIGLQGFGGVLGYAGRI